jgi:hypothetical protein
MYSGASMASEEVEMVEGLILISYDQKIQYKSNFFTGKCF